MSSRYNAASCIKWKNAWSSIILRAANWPPLAYGGATKWTLEEARYVAINVTQSARVRDDKIRSACSHAEKSRLPLMREVKARWLTIACRNTIASKNDGDGGLTTKYLFSPLVFHRCSNARRLGLSDYAVDKTSVFRLVPLRKLDNDYFLIQVIRTRIRRFHSQKICRKLRIFRNPFWRYFTNVSVLFTWSSHGAHLSFYHNV